MELSQQGKSVCKDPRATEGTEHMRTWAKTRVANHRQQIGGWWEMKWERAESKDLGPYFQRNGKLLEVFKQGTNKIGFVLYNYSQCSVENELERTREEVERPTWEIRRARKRK